VDALVAVLDMPASCEAIFPRIIHVFYTGFNSCGQCNGERGTKAEVSTDALHADAQSRRPWTRLTNALEGTVRKVSKNLAFVVLDNKNSSTFVARVYDLKSILHDEIEIAASATLENVENRASRHQ
jgi:hypothetical protein